ncbi:hypothetical protein P6U16_12910 [Rhizobium sp. 32-5/1]|uniref:hypothetical protein n=1 Tax=Rhizobium sp. 32-5/1 TaxID=3019602 RepID=UPI00240E04CC|nr:hypothetical protein [Rhizobium sp. 32-5/1]WEZ82102.1 hypothetical protein P6U16_12910 [Rhizobium sp. 32-5/1]
MTKPKNEDLTDQPMTSSTWKPDPAALDLDSQPLPDEAELGNDDNDIPPARSGMSAEEEKPVEAEGTDNPVHHSGRVPNSPLTE